MQICLSECPHSVLCVQISANCVCKKTYFPFAEYCSSMLPALLPSGTEGSLHLFASFLGFVHYDQLSLVSA